jgi:hypothetical protein
MSASNFRELLSKPTDAVERPRPLADGHYVGKFTRHEFGTSRNKQTPYARFFVSPREEMSDVAEGANTGMDLTKKELYKDYYITPDALYRLSDMLDATLGKQTGRSFDQRIPETRDLDIMFQVTHRDVVDDNGEVVNTFNDIGTIVAAK